METQHSNTTKSSTRFWFFLSSVQNTRCVHSRNPQQHLCFVLPVYMNKNQSISLQHLKLENFSLGHNLLLWTTDKAIFNVSRVFVRVCTQVCWPSLTSSTFSIAITSLLWWAVHPSSCIFLQTICKWILCLTLKVWLGFGAKKYLVGVSKRSRFAVLSPQTRQETLQRHRSKYQLLVLHGRLQNLLMFAKMPRLVGNRTVVSPRCHTTADLSAPW